MKSAHRHTRRMLAGLSLALAGGLATGAFAAPGGPGGHGMGPGAMAGGHWGHGGAGGMFEGMLQRLLDRVNATPEQRTQIQQILQSGAADVRARHEEGRALREQAMALFAQPTVDAAALEALRQKQLAMHDDVTKRMAASMLEISRVLTPDQRKQMAEYMTQRRELMQRHRRERQSIDGPTR
jgi:protein CpxP